MATEETKPLLEFRKPEDFIITQKDINLFLGSGELKRCALCGEWPISLGETIEGSRGKAIRWTIQCTRIERSVPDCTASVWAVDPDQDKARADAVRRWNRRPEGSGE